MKKLIYMIAGVLFLGTGAASAQKVGHVNSQELVLGLPKYAQAKGEIEKFNKERMAEYDGYKAKYNQMVATFEKEAPALDESVKQSRYADILDMEKRMGEFEQTHNENLQKKEQLLMDPIVKTVKEAIAKVAKAQGINYVIDTGTLVYFDGGNDLSELVKKELEKPVVPTTPVNNTPANNKPAGK
jgi:outer membrane protein